MAIITRASIFLVFLALSAAGLRAQQPPAWGADFDSGIERVMRERRVPGAVLAVVTSDRILLMRAYGVADLSAGTPMRPDTVLGIQSTSKLLTGLTVLSAASRRTVNLDADITSYLDGLVLRPRSGGSISMNHLLTHTAGFDERGVGVSARDVARLRSLGDYLSDNLPERLWSPGAVASYSNHGFAIAGLVLEKALGRGLAELAAEEIFEPLGMRSSSFEQPAPAHVLKRKAIGYMWRNGPVAVPPIFHQDWPAAGAVSTAADMSKLLQALLRGSPAAWRAAVTPHFRAHPDLPGIAPGGFVEQRRRAITLLRHGGDWQDFFNLVVLVPADDLGIFIATTHGEDHAFGEVALDAILEATVPAFAKAGAVQEASAPDPIPPGAAGTYRFTRHEHGGLGKLGVLAGQIPEVHLTGDPDTADRSGTFRRAGGGELWAFREARDGNPAFLFRERVPIATYERVAWIRTARIQRVLWGLALVLIIVRLVWAVVHRRWTLADTALAVLLVFVAGIGVILGRADPWELQYGLPLAIRLWLLLPWMAAVIAVAAFVRRRSYVAFVLTIFVFVLIKEWNLWMFWI